MKTPPSASSRHLPSPVAPRSMSRPWKSRERIEFQLNLRLSVRWLSGSVSLFSCIAEGVIFAMFQQEDVGACSLDIACRIRGSAS